MSEVVKLHAGDLRCSRFLDALEEVVRDKGIGMPMPAIIGCIDLLKDIVKDMAHHE